MNDSEKCIRSRRSSVASINIRQPTWKGSSLARPTTPLVAVTAVVAEPELDSALNSASGILSSNPPVSQSTGPGEINAGSRKATTNNDDSTTGLNAKSSLPNISVNPPSRRSRTTSSLFSSMSRAKGKASLRALTQNQTQQALQPVVQPINVDIAPSPLSGTMTVPIRPSSSPGATTDEALAAALSSPPDVQNQASHVAQSAVQYPVPQHTELLPSPSPPPQHLSSSYSLDSSPLLPPAPLYTTTDQSLPPIDFPSGGISKDNREFGLIPPSVNQQVSVTSPTSPPSIDGFPSTPPAYSPPIIPEGLRSVPTNTPNRFTLNLPFFGRTRVSSGMSSNDQSQTATITNAIQESIIKPATRSVESLPVLASPSPLRPADMSNTILNSETSTFEGNPDVKLVGNTSVNSPTPEMSPFSDRSIQQAPHDTQPTRINHRQHTTWWEYVGWIPNSNIVNDVKGPGVEADDVKEVNEDVSLDHAAGPEVSSSVNEGKMEEVDPLRAERMTAIPASPASTGAMPQPTQIEGGFSAWYTPWSWYGSAPGSQAVEAQIEADSRMKEDSPLESGMATTQVAIQEATVAIPPNNATIIKEQHESEEPRIESNPIATSFESNALGWASFFTTRMLGMKRITYEVDAQTNQGDVLRDQNGMEVMDIDEDEDVAPEERGRNSDVKLPVIPSQTLLEDMKKEMPRFPSLTPRKGNSGSTTPTPPSPASPALVSESTKTTTKTKASLTTTAASKRIASPTPSKKSIAPSPPNLVLPTWHDTFFTPPRSVLPPKPQSHMGNQGGGLLGKTMKLVSGVLWTKDKGSPVSPSTTASSITSKGKGRASEAFSTTHGSVSQSTSERGIIDKFRDFGEALPKAWKVFEDDGWNMGTQSGTWQPNDILRGCRKVVVVGVHGWFPGTMIRTVLGEPTGTSTKFASMMEQALTEFEIEYGVKFEKISTIPLEGEGTIEKRVERLYSNLQANSQWMSDLHEADVIIVATHSQGCVVSTHLLDKLIRDGHIITSNNQTFPLPSGAESFPSAIGVADSCRTVQKICCLNLCGIHLGPLRYLSSSTLVGPYLQYFESTAARELFEFQNTESQVSKAYVKALEHVLNCGTKMVYVASLNDQVVPIYSGLFTAVSHPLILRALYIDGDAYHTSDFLSNLLVLLIRILNTGISDSGLLAHLSEATAGSLNGVGHSSVYEELATYSLAVKYLFLTNDGVKDNSRLEIERFNASHEQNDYEIPWALRDIIADDRVAHFFSREFSELRDVFRDWHPKTSILRDLKRKLQPITRLPAGISRL